MAPQTGGGPKNGSPPLCEKWNCNSEKYNKMHVKQMVPFLKGLVPNSFLLHVQVKIFQPFCPKRLFKYYMWFPVSLGGVDKIYAKTIGFKRTRPSHKSCFWASKLNTIYTCGKAFWLQWKGVRGPFLVPIVGWPSTNWPTTWPLPFLCSGHQGKREKMEKLSKCYWYIKREEITTNLWKAVV